MTNIEQSALHAIIRIGAASERIADALERIATKLDKEEQQ